MSRAPFNLPRLLYTPQHLHNLEAWLFSPRFFFFFVLKHKTVSDTHRYFRYLRHSSLICLYLELYIRHSSFDRSLNKFNFSSTRDSRLSSAGVFLSVRNRSGLIVTFSLCVVYADTARLHFELYIQPSVVVRSIIECFSVSADDFGQMCAESTCATR